MRRTRLGNARALSSKLVFVLIALAFVGSGYLIGKYFLASLFQKIPGTGEPVSGEPTGGDQTTATVEIATDALTLYRVQIGAFSSRENADKAVLAAEQKGVGASVMSPDPLHKVYCGIAKDKATAEKIATAVQPKLAGSVIGKDDNLYISTLEVPATRFSITGPKTQVEAIQVAYNRAVGAVKDLVDFWEAQFSGQASSVSLATAQAELAAAKTALAGFTPDASLSIVYNSAQSLLSSVEGAIAAAEESVGGDSQKGVAGMQSFITCVDSFMQDVNKAST